MFKQSSETFETVCAQARAHAYTYAHKIM